MQARCAINCGKSSTCRRTSAAQMSMLFSMNWLRMARLRSIPRLLRRFAQLDYRKRLLLAEAAFGLLAARFAPVYISFPRLARRFGTLVSATDPRLLRANTATDQALIAT